MKDAIFFAWLIAATLLSELVPAQSPQLNIFPQEKVNESLKSLALQNTQQKNLPENSTLNNSSSLKPLLDSYTRLKEFCNEFNDTHRSQAPDTVFVGLVPNDTLVITGNYFNNGPILVFNDGVLIFENAVATILGDVYVFQHGSLFADSSNLNFPQQYYYQRSLFFADSSFGNIQNTTLDYGGLSHNLIIAQNAELNMQDIIFNGWTTAGTFENPVVTANGLNQGGEYIIYGNADVSFTNTTTLLLWYHLPQVAVVDYAFPPGGSVSNYVFNNSIPNINGIDYSLSLTNCNDVMWGLMPVNGSDVTISNSTLRTIGAWFERGDSVNVSGLVNNSAYTNFIAPLTDRYLHLINTQVQTWSLYVFDSSFINLTGCIVGEVGSQGTSQIIAQNVFCDGTGGYYWATDQSFSVAGGSSVSSNVRSERNGLMIFGYGSVNGTATAIGNSLLVVVQSSSPQDPVPYDGSVAWYAKINGITPSFVDTFVIINGSAWIDQGPLGSFMDFGSYHLSYSPSSGGSYTPIGGASTNEIHNSILGTWDTHGLTPGTYNLRLTSLNNFGDSVDAVIQVTLLPSILSDGVFVTDESLIKISPNPASEFWDFYFASELSLEKSMLIMDLQGRIVLWEALPAGREYFRIRNQFLSKGVYYYKIETGNEYYTGSIIKL
jgi:hypothetical protein